MLIDTDLAFLVGNGLFHAIDADTQPMLWTLNGATIRQETVADSAPIANVTDGREYVVNAWGGNKEDLFVSTESGK